MEAWCGTGGAHVLVSSNGGGVVYPSPCLTDTALLLVDAAYILGSALLLLLHWCGHHRSSAPCTSSARVAAFTLLSLGLTAVGGIMAWDAYGGGSGYGQSQGWARLLGGAAMGSAWLLASVLSLIDRDSVRGMVIGRRALAGVSLVVVCVMAPSEVDLYQRRETAKACARLSIYACVVLALLVQSICTMATPLPKPLPPSKRRPAVGDLQDQELGEPLLREAEVGHAREPGLEAKASLISRMTFWWTTPALTKAYRDQKLELHDLPPLEGGDEPGMAYQRFFERWSRLRGQVNHARSRGMRLGLCVYRVFWRDFWMCAAVLFLSSSMTLAVPMALNALLSYIENQDLHDRDPYMGFLLALGLFVLVVGVSLTEHQFWILGVRCGMRAQLALMAETFRKSLCLNPDGRRRYSTGELINLMSVDAPRVADVCLVPMLHWGTWAAIYMVAVALTCLYQLLGPSSFVGVGIILIFWPIGFLVGRVGKQAALEIQHFRDIRAKIFSEGLNSMRLIKSLQWEEFAANVIREARQSEYHAQIKRQTCFGANGVLAQLAQVLGPVAAFSVSIRVAGRPLTASEAFTALAWFNMLKRPLNLFPSALTNLMDCLVSWDRLEALFLWEETGPLLQSQPAATSARSSKYAIDVRNQSFSWSSDQPPVLQDISFRARKGELLVVVGGVGAGKSSFLSSLIGDCVEVGSGRKVVRGSIAYVAQTPWLQNASIRDNILFGSHVMDEDRLEATVRCSGLQYDVASMPGGLDMEVGEGGVNLSGGQKSRLNLARALYANADIYLLDDILSSLDTAVGRRIFEDCLAKYLEEKTIILVTHQTQFLQHRAVDRVVVLCEGTVIAEGTYLELMASRDKRVLEAVLGTQKTGAVEDGEGDGEEGAAEGKDEGREGEVTFGGEEGEESGHESGDGSRESGQGGKGFVEEEQRREGTIELGLLLQYLWRYGQCGGLIYPLLVLVCFIVEQCVNVLQWFWLSHLTSGASEVQGSQVLVLMSLGGALCLIGAVRIILVINGAVTAGNKIHAEMLNALFRAPISFFDRQLSGRLLNRFIADQAAIDSIVPATLADFLANLLYFGSTLAVLCYALPEMLPFVAILAWPYLRVSNYYRWGGRDVRRLEAMSKSPVNSHFAEAVKGASVIRAFGAQESFMQDHLQLSTTMGQTYWFKWNANQWVTIFLELVGTAFTLFCGLLSVWATGPSPLQSHVDAGKMGLLMSYAVLVPSNLGWLLKVWFLAEIEFVSVERVFQYIGIEAEDKEDLVMKVQMCASPRSEDGSEVKQNEEEGAVSVDLKRVFFRYGEDSDMVLRGVNLSVPAGKKTAVVGRTAAGKSSIFQILLGFYKCEEGSQVLLDGIDIDQIPLEKLRKTARLIPQTPTLFGTTLRSALVGEVEEPGTKSCCAFSEEDIWQVLSRCGISKAIEALPEGLDTQVTSIEFSAGERQLLCIARALLHKAPLMLCDEITSNIDMITDAKIHDVLFSLHECTVLSICHRLHHISQFDHVIVMMNGVAVEQGEPALLLKDPNTCLSQMQRMATFGPEKARSY